MNPKPLLQHFDRLADNPQAIPHLRRFILDLAVRGKLVEQDPNDEPASELLKLIQAARLKYLKKSVPKSSLFESASPAHSEKLTIPQSWVWVSIGDICTKTGSGSTPAGGKAAYPDSGILFLRSQNVYNEGLRLEEVAYISETTHQKMKGSTVRPLDLLLNITGGSIGRCAIVPASFDEGNVNQHVAILRLALPACGAFCHLVILSTYFQNEIFGSQTGAGREGLPKNRMDAIPVPLPPLAEQHRIVAKVDELMALCDHLEAAQRDREATRDRLATAALSRLTTNDAQESSQESPMSNREPTITSDEPTVSAYETTISSGELTISSGELTISSGELTISSEERTMSNGEQTTSFEEPTMSNHESVRFYLNLLPRLATRPEHVKEIRQTILNLAVRGKLVPQDPSDEPASELLKRIQAEQVRLVKIKEIKRIPTALPIRSKEIPYILPESWQWARMSSLLREDSQNGCSAKPDEAPDGIPILRISAGTVRTDGIVAEEEYKLISRITDGQRKQYSLERGDLLACRFNGNKKFVGRLTLYLGYSEISPIYPDKLIRLRLLTNLVSPNLIRFFAKSDLVRSDIENYCATTVGNWGISASNLKEVKVPLPPLAEQQRIVAKVDSLMALCDDLEAQLSATRSESGRLLEAVLHEALAG